MLQDTHMRRQLYVSLGLSEKEALLYDLLLQRGEMAASQLEKEAGLKKNTYHLLKALEQRKLVLKIIRDGKSFYQAGSPENLRIVLSEQKKALQDIGGTLEELLPNLKSTYATSVGKPVIRYLQGTTGLQEVFQDIYSPENKEVYGCVDLETVDGVFPDHITRDLIPKRVEYGIQAYSLVAKSPAAEVVAGHDAEQLRETVLFDKQTYPLPAEVEVYRDRVSLMSFDRGDMVGLIIEHKDFATSMRSIFQYLFALKRENEALRAQASQKQPRHL